MITKNKISTKFKTTKLKRVNSDTKKDIVKKPIDKKKQSSKKKKQVFANFIDTGNKELNSYTKRAFIGALVGGLGGLIIGKKIILGILIGGLAGGYITYELNKIDNIQTTKFKI